jgi:hypothetical protein
MLTPKQQRFVEEYLVDLNATQAAIRAGYSERNADKIGPELLGKTRVAAAIAAAQQARSDRTGITQDDVLRDWVMLANADPNELIEHRRTCCRFCHGANHEYQRTAGELKRDRTAHEARKGRKGPFDEQGGAGYDARRNPHHDCPECFGEGVSRTFVKDTRKLSKAARLLYAGVKETKDGIEIKMHDQDAARVNVAKHLGMFTEKHELSGPNGQPIQNEHSGTVEPKHALDPGAFRSFMDGVLAAGVRPVPSDGHG